LETTRLSTKGQIIVPRTIRQARQWKPGTEFQVEEVTGGILLRPLKPFAPTLLKDVAGRLKYAGRPKTLEEMNRTIAKEIRARRDRGRY
jgi:AbrB family looped-hinge helix DNA binding protein